MCETKKEIDSILVEVPVEGLSIIYNGEHWYTLDSMAIREGITRRGIEQRIDRGGYLSKRVCGILIWKKEEGVSK